MNLNIITGDDRILLIADRKLDITWMLNPEDKIYMELKGINAAFFNPIRGWEAAMESTKEEQVELPWIWLKRKISRV